MTTVKTEETRCLIYQISTQVRPYILHLGNEIETWLCVNVSHVLRSGLSIMVLLSALWREKLGQEIRNKNKDPKIYNTVKGSRERLNFGAINKQAIK